MSGHFQFSDWLSKMKEKVHFQKDPEFYRKKALDAGAKQTNEGALIIKTGEHTGRAAEDKYVVLDKESKEKVWWNPNVKEMSQDVFENLLKKTLGYLESQNELFSTVRSLGSMKEHALKIQFVSSHSVYALFTCHMFRDYFSELEQKSYVDRSFTILHAPMLKVEDFANLKLRSSTVIVTDFTRKIVLIIGSQYSGEIKKSAFSILNYILPDVGILPMHAGANKNSAGQVSVFFGLSGTGKTTLSTDEGHLLIGDDEHGLSAEGIFNFEGGCYAKTHQLSFKSEPGIFKACHQKGAIFENVVYDAQKNAIDFNDASITENGRVSYPLKYIDEVEPSAQGKTPKHIFFLCADAFGVLPAIAKLDSEMAIYYFLLGYTSKLAGTEMGIKEPKMAFSTCFGAPFMLRKPMIYASLLKSYLQKNQISVWLVNTGWTKGPYGVGQRFPLNVTRQIIRLAQSGSLEKAAFRRDDLFEFKVPTLVQGIDEGFFNPSLSAPDKEDFKKRAQNLRDNFKKKFDEMINISSSTAPSSPHQSMQI